MQKAKQILVGCVGLLFICAAIYIFTDCGGPSTSVTRPTATEPYVRAVTRIATSVPAPAVGTVAATPKPGIPPDVQLYALQINPIVSDASNAMGELVALLSALDVGNDTWTAATVLQMVVLKGLHARALAIDNVPADMAQVHLMLLRSTDKLSDCMDQLAYGLDNNDVPAVESAGRLLIEATSDLNEANALLNTYAAAHAAP